MPTPEPRKGMPDPYLDQETFTRRFLSQYLDPAFDSLDEAKAAMAGGLGRLLKSSQVARTRKAGREFDDPDYDLAVDSLTSACTSTVRRR